MRTQQTSGIRRIAAGASCGLLALALVAMSTTNTAEAAPDITDVTIADAVYDEIDNDPAVPEHVIDISVVNGVVTLKGKVSNLVAKRHAARQAKSIRGVRSVVNRIVVDPIWNRTDNQLRRDVRRALLYDPVTESWELRATVNNGVVTLTGEVDSWAERRLAERVAGGVMGTKDVRNEIKVTYKTGRSEREIADEVRDKLRWDALVDHGYITTVVKDDKVILSGAVGSAGERDRAYWDAWVAGVTEVDVSRLEVKSWARNRYQRKETVRVTDGAIEEAVKDALLFDPRVASYKVNVSSVGNVVTLRGVVRDLRAKRAAAQDARHTTGVVSVVNRIRVRAGTPADRQLENRVTTSLRWDPYVEKYEIEVDVDQGIARLTGKVDSYFEKGRAEEIAAKTYGVEQVINGLEVRNKSTMLLYEPYVGDYYPYDYSWYVYEITPPGRDLEIKREINDELFWSPFVDANQVLVHVDDGIATLTGTVESWAERSAAVTNAYEGGAVLVDDELKVRLGGSGSDRSSQSS